MSSKRFLCWACGRWSPPGMGEWVACSCCGRRWHCQECRTVEGEPVTTIIEQIKEKVERRERLDVDDALFLLDRQVEAKGEEYVYSNPSLDSADDCINVHRKQDGTLVPGCIVGHVAAELFPINRVPVEGSVFMLNELLGFPFTSDAQEVLFAAQNAQDMGKDWGRAVEAARVAADRLVRDEVVSA